MSTCTINTGIQVQIPPGFYGRIEERSSTASTNRTVILGGIIDSGYNGTVYVMKMNLHKTQKYFIHRGTKVAQLVIQRCEYPDLIKVASLVQTERGSKGFGSSDKH